MAEAVSQVEVEAEAEAEAEFGAGAGPGPGLRRGWARGSAAARAGAGGKGRRRDRVGRVKQRGAQTWPMAHLRGACSSAAPGRGSVAKWRCLKSVRGSAPNWESPLWDHSGLRGRSGAVTRLSGGLTPRRNAMSIALGATGS